MLRSASFPMPGAIVEMEFDDVPERYLAFLVED